MASKIPPEELEETIKRLGLTRRAANNLRKANEVVDEDAPRRGFGASAQDSTPVPTGI